MNFKSFSILSKLKYLIKHEASISIILAFLKFQLTKPVFNTFRSKEKKLNKEIIKDKLVTDDFFSINAFDWKKNLNQY